MKLNAHRLKWPLVALLIVWIFFAVGMVAVTQKPITPADVAALARVDVPPFALVGGSLGRTALDVLAGLWLWAVAIGLGGWALRWLLPAANGPERLIFGAGVGIGGLGLAVLAMGLLGRFNPAALAGLMLALTVIAAPNWLSLWRLWRNRPKSGRSGLPFLLKIYLALAGGMAFSIALLPPTDWDGLFYHLTGPKLYLQAGRIVPGIDIPHLNFPGLLEMVFAPALALRNDSAAKLMHFGFAPLLAGLVYLTAKRHLRASKSWLAVAFLFSMPMVWTLATWAYNDLALAFFELAALYFLINSSQRPAISNQSLGLSGIFAGLAMGLKYTSVVAPVTLGGLLLWHLWRQRAGWRRSMRAVGQFALPAGLVAAPWYIKSWVFTGNPVYPFVFGGRFWDSFRAAAYSGSGTGIGFDPVAIVTLPYYLTLGIKDANYIDGRTGPLFLALLPLLLAYGVFRYRRQAMPPALDSLLIFALAQFVFWTVGVIFSAGLWQSRLLLPALAALTPALAWLVSDTFHLSAPQFSLQRFLVMVIGLVLILSLVDQVFNNQIHSRSGWLFYRPLAYLIGPESREHYLTRRLPGHYPAMEQLNATLPADAVVQFLWEPRSYYCRVDCRPDSILDEYGHLQYLHGADAAAIARAWRAEGVTHVLVFRLGLNLLLSEPGLAPEIAPDPAVLNALQANFFDEVLDVQGAYQIYRLK